MSESAGGPSVRCELCFTWLPGDAWRVHLSESHPEWAGVEFEQWPDGGVVVEDHTLTPDDFTGGDR